MSTLTKLVLVGLTAYVVLWLSLDGSDEPKKSESAYDLGAEFATEETEPEFVPLDFTPDIPHPSASTSEDRFRQRQAEAERDRSRRADNDRLSRMEVDNAVSRATMGMHTSNPDIGFGTCRYTHNYSVTSRSGDTIRASAEFICTSRDSRTGRTIKQHVWRPVTLKSYGGSWVADRPN